MNLGMQREPYQTLSLTGCRESGGGGVESHMLAVTKPGYSSWASNDLYLKSEYGCMRWYRLVVNHGTQAICSSTIVGVEEDGAFVVI